MVYAGFSKRLGGILIDGLIFLPLTFLYVYSNSRTVTILSIIFSAILGWVYHVYFHARWGQTLGKMATGIKVVSLDGKPIAYRQAGFRSSVDIFLGLIGCALLIQGLLNIPESEYASLTQMAKHLKIQEIVYPWRWLHWLQNIWIWSEVVVMLTNSKKRALHDFIAGTVVIRVDSRD